MKGGSAKTHTHARARLEGGPLSGAQRGSKAHCEPNLGADPSAPPASQPARDAPEITHARVRPRTSAPNGAHPPPDPASAQNWFSTRAPACRNTPRLSARGCHRFLAPIPSRLLPTSRLKTPGGRFYVLFPPQHLMSNSRLQVKPN